MVFAIFNAFISFRVRNRYYLGSYLRSPVGSLLVVRSVFHGPT